MSWEELGALSTFGTLLVIAASAVAAVFQLRHMRAGNQISAALGLMSGWASPDARAMATYVFQGELDRKLEERSYRDSLQKVPIDRLEHPEVAYLDFFESTSTLVKLGYTSEEAFMESAGFQCIAAWHKLMPVIAIIRRTRGPQVYDNFEYVASRAILWEEAHQDGTFPKNAPHLPMTDRYSSDVPGSS
jgi:hypothetical protein